MKQYTQQASDAAGIDVNLVRSFFFNICVRSNVVTGTIVETLVDLNHCSIGERENYRDSHPPVFGKSRGPAGN